MSIKRGASLAELSSSLGDADPSTTTRQRAEPQRAELERAELDTSHNPI